MISTLVSILLLQMFSFLILFLLPQVFLTDYTYFSLIGFFLSVLVVFSAPGETQFSTTHHHYTRREIYFRGEGGRGVTIASAPPPSPTCIHEDCPKRAPFSSPSSPEEFSTGSIILLQRIYFRSPPFRDISCGHSNRLLENVP